MLSIISVHKKKVLILGISSWLGYLLMGEFSKDGNYIVGGTYYNTKIPTVSNILLFKCTKNTNSTIEVIKNFHPEIIVNFLRDENESGYTIHEYASEYCSLTGAFYLYASSILALDGYSLGTNLVEDLDPNSISAYGKFKGKCEMILKDYSLNYAIVRFASVQGWVPHRVTRNESFIRKLSDGIIVNVDSEIYQNRILASKLIFYVKEIISREIEGIVHIGTLDSSSELTFLKNIATAFGYNPDLVSEKAGSERNLVAKSLRLQKLFPNNHKNFEKETINQLATIPGLRKYMNKRFS